jgi:hypothetical protein
MKSVLKLSVASFATASATGAEPNPPTWSSNVKYFKSANDTDWAAYQKILTDVHT